jgi:MoaA/NifB/PqqE/SkfB family radical SAM enzyme
MFSYGRELLPKMMRYRLAKMGMVSPGSPINLTFSVTNICQSRCKTCSIWSLYKEQPGKRAQELTLQEIEKIFAGIGHVYIFNISGGEPFLRKNLYEIVQLACRYLTPGIIHVPTNAIAADSVVEQTRRILAYLDAHFPSTQLTVKPSLDHIGKRHDRIRGVPGNFAKVMDLFQRLKALHPNFPHFHVELGTVISAWNVNDIDKIASFVTSLGPDSYRNEIAEQRSEMFNRGQAITPSAREYEAAIGFFVNQITRYMKSKSLFQRITSAFRLVYYDLAIRILKEERQVIPCYAGISNVHLSPYGDVWPCCTLGYDHSFGNLRDFDLDFQRLWRGRQAAAVRRAIGTGFCHCPLANQVYSNILLHPPSLGRVLKLLFKGK